MQLPAPYSFAPCGQSPAAPINHKPVIIIRIRAIVISTTILSLEALVDDVLKRVPAQLLRHPGALILKVAAAAVAPMLALPPPIPLPYKRGAERLAVLIVAITVGAGPNACTANAILATVCCGDGSSLQD